VAIANALDPFATFLTRAGAYTSVFTSARRKIVLVEDLPNILHPAVRSRFHDAVRAHVERAWDVAPLVLVVSDAGVCAEGYSNGNGGSGSSRARDLVIDARTVVPPGLSSASSQHFSEIRSVRFRATLRCFRLWGVTDRWRVGSTRLRPRCSLWR